MAQRHEINEAKALLEAKEDELVALKQLMHFIEQFILQEERISADREKNLTKKTMKKLKHGQRNKKDKLKAALGGIRDGN